MAGTAVKKYSKDMTSGDSLRLIVSFMFPMMIGNIFQQFYNIVDTIIAGKFIDANALAAVGSTGNVTNLFFALGNGLAAGIGIVISQFFGANDTKGVRKTITNAFYIVLIISAFIGIAGFLLARPVLTYGLKTPENILDNAVAYMSIICVGFVGSALYNTISSIMRGVGDSKTPLYFLIVSSFLNIIMDLTFVIYLGLGVKGLAIATITAQFLSALTSISYALIKNPMFKFKKKDFLIDRDIILRSCKLGGSMAIQSGMMAFSFVVLQRVINSFGSVVIAAFTATSKIENIVNMQLKALADSLSTYSGQNFGAKNGERLQKGYQVGITLMGFYSVVMIPLVWIFGDAMMRVFVNEPDVIAFGKNAMRILSCFYLPLGTIYVCRGILNGAGDAKFPVISGAAEMTGRIIFPAFFCSIPFLGAWGLWVATGVTWIIVGITAFIRYHMKDWRNGLF
ncbi:MAG: MATE family efflux transporter [Lachnospiraceae bacterium]|nr:MATE family efflux transporter [Lachnospiraceae bacterium]